MTTNFNINSSDSVDVLYQKLTSANVLRTRDRLKISTTLKLKPAAEKETWLGNKLAKYAINHLLENSKLPQQKQHEILAKFNKNELPPAEQIVSANMLIEMHQKIIKKEKSTNHNINLFLENSPLSNAVKQKIRGALDLEDPKIRLEVAEKLINAYIIEATSEQGIEKLFKSADLPSNIESRIRMESERPDFEESLIFAEMGVQYALKDVNRMPKTVKQEAIDKYNSELNAATSEESKQEESKIAPIDKPKKSVQFNANTTRFTYDPEMQNSAPITTTEPCKNPHKTKKKTESDKSN